MAACFVARSHAGAWERRDKEAILEAAGKETFDEFGCAVAVSGDTIIVGAQHDASGSSTSGSALTLESTTLAGSARRGKGTGPH